MKQVTQTYIFEAKCINKWIVPTMDEYMPNSLISTTVPILVTTEALEWISTFPILLRASSLYCRLTDDMVEDKV